MSNERESTRERILAVAERMFAAHGYNGVSLRSIMKEAGVNSAAIHYHFGTKEALLRAIFETRVKSVTAERQGLLAELMQNSGGKPTVRDIVRAFVGPGLRLGATDDGAQFNRLSAICSVDPDPTVRSIVFGVHDDIARQFVDALRQSCPDLSVDEFRIRLQCIFGSMMYLRADNGRVNRLLERPAQRRSYAHIEADLERLLDFLVAGMEAP